MPSFQDSALIVVLALLLFGPKGMAKLARELGKLMGEFRRASSDFRMQMEEEFRLSEQADQQKKIAAMEAAAPVTPAFPPSAPVEEIAEPEHPHLPPVAAFAASTASAPEEVIAEHRIDMRAAVAETEPLPIASAGDLHLMPPATGLPVSRSLGAAFTSIPHTPDPAIPVEAESATPEAANHG